LGGSLIGVVILILTSFFRGWVVSARQVSEITKLQNLRLEESIARGNEYKEALLLSEKRGDVLQKLVDTTTTVGETVNRILNSLPDPHTGGTNGEKVNQQ
jgi:hypothetical protein